MIVHNLDPVFFDFGFIQIRWYSLAYIFGILIGWLYGKKILTKQVSQNNTKIYLSKYDDLITYIIIGIIVGGRLGYVLFYNLNFYLENIFEIITEKEDFYKIKTELEKKIETFNYSSIEWRPLNYIDLAKDKCEQLIEVLSALEELDDVQNIFTNANLKNLH